MDDHFVSVILPVFNRASRVRAAIESVIDQTWSRWELIVVDDGSTDSTRDVVASFGDRVRLIEGAHGGAHRARNVGVREARGDLVAFIDSDDRWFSWRLASQIPLLENPDVGLVYGNGFIVDERPESEGRSATLFDKSMIPRRGRVVDSLIVGNFIPMSSVLVRRAVLASVGAFAETRMAADYLQWIRVARLCELDYVPEPVFEYSVHKSNLTGDLGAALEARIELFLDVLPREATPRDSAEIAEVIAQCSMSYWIWGVRNGESSRVRAFRREHRLPHAGIVQRARWLARFVALRMRRRIRRWFHPRARA